jgi:uncharacterized protein
MTSRSSVEGFLAHRGLAVVGVSRTGRGFAHAVWRSLRNKGWNAVPVNPGAASIDGIACYPTLREVPPDTVEAAVVVTPRAASAKVVEDAAAAGIRWLWLQQGSASDEALRLCRENGIEAVSGECILMHADGTGIHGFHKWVWNILGKLPQ